MILYAIKNRTADNGPRVNLLLGDGEIALLTPFKGGACWTTPPYLKQCFSKPVMFPQIPQQSQSSTDEIITAIMTQHRYLQIPPNDIDYKKTMLFTRNPAVGWSGKTSDNNKSFIILKGVNSCRLFLYRDSLSEILRFISEDAAVSIEVACNLVSAIFGYLAVNEIMDKCYAYTSCTHCGATEMKDDYCFRCRSSYPSLSSILKTKRKGDYGKANNRSS